MKTMFELSMGFMVILLAMTLHLGSTIFIVRIVRPFQSLIKGSPYLFISITLVLTNLIFFVTHLVGVSMWAYLYLFLGLAPDFPDAFYSAFIMNTTLGTGNIQPEIGTRLLIPMTASSGIIMIGWSTAVFIYIVQSCLPHIAHRN